MTRASIAHGFEMEFSGSGIVDALEEAIADDLFTNCLVTLLEAGLDANCKGQSAFSILCETAYNLIREGKPSTLVEILLNRGANPGLDPSPSISVCRWRFRYGEVWVASTKIVVVERNNDVFFIRGDDSYFTEISSSQDQSEDLWVEGSRLDGTLTDSAKDSTIGSDFGTDNYESETLFCEGHCLGLCSLDPRPGMNQCR